MKKAKLYLLNILRMMFPTNIEQLLILLLFIVGYGILATDIALGYSVVFDLKVPWDAYFSFDNRAIVLTGGGVERHPLASYFFDGIRNIALWYSDGKYDANFRLILSYFSATAISFSLLQIYKYLRNIIQLNFGVSFLLILFTALFSTTILLSFTPETYTYTFLLLTFFNYYAANKIQKEEKMSGVSVTLFAVLTGGLTITNIVKVYLPFLFEKDLFKKWKNFFIAALKVVVSVIVFLLLVLQKLNWDYEKVLTKGAEQYERFSQPKAVPLWDMMLSWFFGGNVIFSSIFTRDYNTKDNDYKAIFMDVFTGVGPYVFVGLLLFLVVWSIVKNYKNKLAWILVISFSIDMIIHCVLKFGLHTSYIYGGHFVFVYPLLIGWLISSYKRGSTPYYIVLFFLIPMLCFLGINNFYRFQDFYGLINLYYK